GLVFRHARAAAAAVVAAVGRGVRRAFAPAAQHPARAHERRDEGEEQYPRMAHGGLPGRSVRLSRKAAQILAAKKCEDYPPFRRSVLWPGAPTIRQRSLNPMSHGRVRGAEAPAYARHVSKYSVDTVLRMKLRHLPGHLAQVTAAIAAESAVIG